MFNFIAGAFVGVASFWHGMFGGGHPMMASSTPDRPHTHMASSSPWREGTSTPGIMDDHMNPGVRGTVSAIQGATITVSGRTGIASSTPLVSYTVDTSSAKVLKFAAGQAPSALAAADIKVGDLVSVEGALSGTHIVAKVIIDGTLPPRGEGMMHPRTEQQPPR